jgi:uncharacterized SAM-binding protein YcdF (DUF218 family)
MQNMTPEIAVISNAGFRKRRRLRKAIFAAALIITALSALMWFNRGTLLRYAAEQWVVSDNIQPADAVLVLGGGIDTRPFAAAEDYRNSLAHKILVTNVRPGRAETLGVLPSHAEINRRVLIKLGVPEADIETLDTTMSTTYGESRALRDWVIRTHARSVIVPTEAFSSRRVRWTLTEVLAGTGTSVQIQALDYPDYSYLGWWKANTGLIGFQNEVMKYLYYRYKY